MVVFGVSCPPPWVQDGVKQRARHLLAGVSVLCGGACLFPSGWGHHPCVGRPFRSALIGAPGGSVVLHPLTAVSRPFTPTELSGSVCLEGLSPSTGSLSGANLTLFGSTPSHYPRGGVGSTPSGVVLCFGGKIFWSRQTFL